MTIIDILSERFPIVAAAIKSGSGPIKVDVPEIPESVINDFRTALAAIPDSMIPVIESASLKFAVVISSAIEKFVHDVGAENVMAAVDYVSRKFGDKKEFLN